MFSCIFNVVFVVLLQTSIRAAFRQKNFFVQNVKFWNEILEKFRNFKVKFILGESSLKIFPSTAVDNCLKKTSKESITILSLLSELKGLHEFKMICEWKFCVDAHHLKISSYRYLIQHSVDSWRFLLPSSSVRRGSWK